MEKLAEMRLIHNRGICNIRAKFPALHLFMFYAKCCRANKGRSARWLTVISVHKRNIKAGHLPATTLAQHAQARCERASNHLARTNHVN